uniref:G_PROTEIN_RECEP_F1_2 domain-containing protein n=1 Tax=Parastrongyloides trichosuri TaxID=131310 RepID=A0A0N4ZIL8_PARTI
MLFMHNKSYSLPGDINDSAVDRTSLAEKRRINKLILIMLLLYILTSIITLFLHLPISIITIIIPTLTIPFSIWAIRYDVKPARNISLNSTCTCLCLKLISIIVFYIIFEKNKLTTKIKDESYARRIAVLDQRNKEYDMKAIFMAATILGEILIFLLYSCLQWHRVARKNNSNDTEIVRF